MFTAFIAILIVVGIAGTLLPMVPGVGLVWTAIVVFAVVEGLGATGWGVLVLVTLIAGSAIYLGFRIPQKAAAGSIGFRGQLFAVVLAIVGFFLIPVVGAPIGFVVGVYVTMLLVDRSEAWESTKATLRSLIVASGVQFGAAVAMGVVWVVWVTTGWVNG